MSGHERELVEQLHRQAAEDYYRQKQKERALVEGMFRDALEREREKKAHERALVEQVHREAIEQDTVQTLPPREPPKGVHHTQLPEAKPGSPLAVEWTTYRREVGRWLAEGLVGQYVLIKGEELIGTYGTAEEALSAGFQRFLLQPFLVHPIRTEEPYRRIRGISFPCPGSRLR